MLAKWKRYLLPIAFILSVNAYVNFGVYDMNTTLTKTLGIPFAIQ
jgi:hypothetical protein